MEKDRDDAAQQKGEKPVWNSAFTNPTENPFQTSSTVNVRDELKQMLAMSAKQASTHANMASYGNPFMAAIRDQETQQKQKAAEANKKLIIHEGEEEIETVEADPYKLSANKHMHIRFIRSPEAAEWDQEEGDVSGNEHHEGSKNGKEALLSRLHGYYRPRYTHQIFNEDETVDGFIGLDIRMTFLQDTCHCLLELNWDEKGPMADPNFLYSSIVQYMPHEDTSDQVGVFTDKKEFFKVASERSSNWTPPGEMVFHYKKTGEEGVLYEIWKADYTNIDCVHLYERVQIFNIMYIDAASTIDSTDEKWLVFFVYRREEKSASSSSGYKLVGFSSVYPFWIPLDSLRHRISQFLILPEYQGSGHGVHLLKSIIEDGMKNSKVVDISVESPSPDFQGLRDRVDSGRALESGLCDVKSVLAKYEERKKDAAQDSGKGKGKEKEMGGSSSSRSRKPLAFRVPPEIATALSALKIPKLQAQRIYEILRLAALTEGNEEAKREYRIDIKRRLYKENSELMDSFADEEDRKAELQILYEELIESYNRTLKFLRIAQNL